MQTPKINHSEHFMCREVQPVHHLNEQNTKHLFFLYRTALMESQPEKELRPYDNQEKRASRDTRNIKPLAPWVP